MSAGDTIRVATFNDDFENKLYTPICQQVTTSQQKGNEHVIEYQATSSGEYRIRVGDELCDGYCLSVDVTACDDPNAPTGVSASDETFCDEVRVTWNSVSGADSYKVYRSSSNNACSGSPIGTPTSSPYDDTSATPGTTYYYSVRATNDCGDSNCSSTNSGERAVSTAAPAGVSATDETFCDKVRVTWIPVSGANSYKVYRSFSNNACSGSPIGTPTSSPYDDISVPPGTTYYYSVRATNDCGDSYCSSTDSGERDGFTTTPTNVSATDGTSCDEVRVSWNSLTVADSYMVYRSSGNNACSGSPIGTPTSSPYDDTSATPGTTYYYSVKATNHCGNSSCSSTDSGERDASPTAPVGVSASDGTFCDKVRVTWNLVSGAESYEVYRSSSNNACSGSLIGTPTSSLYDDTSAKLGITYYYSVNAINDCGDSNCSSADSGIANCGSCDSLGGDTDDDGVCDSLVQRHA